MATFPNCVALARNAVECVERAHAAPLAEIELLAATERHHAPGDAASVEGFRGGEHALHVGSDAGRHHVDALAHVHHGPARGVLNDGTHVIEVSVAHQHD